MGVGERLRLTRQQRNSALGRGWPGKGRPAKSPAATAYRHDNPLSYNPPQYKPPPGLAAAQLLCTPMKQVRRTLPRLLRLLALTALMGTGVVYVMTHDSIGLGEDGPTHQPVEHLSSLRAMPNMRVFRPCDAVEVAECWELALNRTNGPTVLALTRQNVPQLRNNAPSDNPCSHGGYELVAAQGEARVSLFASGSEVEIAVAAQKELAGRGIATRVVSVPSLELLLSQPEDRQKAVIGNAPVKVAIEAAVRWGWDAVIGHDGLFIGMHSFGESGPAKDLYKHFGITAEATVNAVLKRVN